MIKQLPDIITSAGFWASIATLWSASGAWFTFVGAITSSRQQTYEGVLNLILGIEAELALVEEWASGKEGEVGYLKSESGKERLAKAHPDWFNPSRQVFTFDTPTLNSATSSPYASHLTPVLPEFVRLNHAIRRLFDYIKIYQTFVHADPDLYGEVFVLVSQGKYPAGGRGRTYTNIVFFMNRTIHQELIGGMDSPDEGCLYKSFRRARKALLDLKSSLRREALPWWYWILHVVATYLAMNGIWQVVRWFRGNF